MSHRDDSCYLVVGSLTPNVPVMASTQTPKQHCCFALSLEEVTQRLFRWMGANFQQVQRFGLRETNKNGEKSFLFPKKEDG